MKATVYNQKGKELETIELEDGVFSADVNKKVISQYVFSFLSNQRESNAHTKDRSEVSGGGVKPWRQKGTGRARVGSNRSPIWRKGGVVFGPLNVRNWKKKITKSFNKAVLRQSLSSAFSENIKIVDKFEIEKDKPKTKQAVEIKSAFNNPKKITLVSSELNKELISSFNNLPGSRVVFLGELNAYDVLNGGVILFDKKSIEHLNKKLSKNDNN